MAKKSLSLTTRVVLLVAILLFALNAVIGVILTMKSQNTLMYMINMRMLDISNSAAAAIDGDDFEKVTDDTTTNEYKSIYRILRTFQDKITCDYIYSGRLTDDGKIVFVIDPSDDPGFYGEEIIYTEALSNAAHGTPDVDDVAYEDRWGRFYSAYSPIYNSKNEVVGIVGVDFNKEWYDAQLYQNTVAIIVIIFSSLFIGVLVVIVAMSGVRKRFRQVNSELATLSDSISELTDKMEIKGVDIPSNVTDNEVDEQADELLNVGSKLSAMQATLEKFTAYMNKKAYTDMLTGVNNATAYYSVIEHKTEDIKNGTADFAVIIFDLNGLKKINDEYGHAVGDSYIVASVNIMSEALGKENIYRVGGDEFIVVIDNASQQMIDVIFKRLDEATVTENKKPRIFSEKVTFSKGAAIFDPNRDKAFNDVFKRADSAMYDNKEAFHKKMEEKRD